MNRNLTRILSFLCVALWAAGSLLLPAPTARAASPLAETDEGLTGRIVFQTSSGGDIYIVNVDGTGLSRLTSGMDPALSPDGQWVAYSRWSDPAGLFIIRTDGSEERQLLWEDTVRGPMWSADGTRIAFNWQHEGQPTKWTKTFKMKDPRTGKKVTIDMTMPPDPHWKIATIGVADSVVAEMYSHDYSYSPAWSPDGSNIVYASDKGIALTWDGADSAVTRDPNTGRLSTYVNVDRVPSYSPDGQKIALQYKSHDHWEIMVMNADGSGRTLLTKSPVFISPHINSLSPTWSPDGKHIAYLCDKNGAWEIWVMNADGTDQRPLFDAGALDGIAFQYNNVDERMLSWGK